VKVVMNGIGVDELFGGYSTFRYEHLARTPPFAFARMALFPIAPLSRRFVLAAEDRGVTSWPLLMIEQSPHERAQTLFRWYQVRRLTPPARALELLAPEVGRAEALLDPGWDTARERLKDLLNLPESLSDSLPVLEVAGYLSPVLLRDSDAMSMYHSLELRIPFLDTAMVRLALRFSLAELMSFRSGKQPVRRVTAGRIPELAGGRRKQGFGAPLGAWLHNRRVQQAVQDEFVTPSPRLTGLLDPRALGQLVDRFFHDSSSPGRYRLAARVWMLYTLLRWTRMVEPG
jgi:asparagine synthase (glutamine-hydrolysing)